MTCSPWGCKELDTTEGWNSSNKEKPQGHLSGFCMLASSGRAQGYLSYAPLYCRTAPFWLSPLFLAPSRCTCACVCVCVCVCESAVSCTEKFFFSADFEGVTSAHTAHLLSSLFHLLQLVFLTAVLTGLVTEA